jgi:hypothetical protein
VKKHRILISRKGGTIDKHLIGDLGLPTSEDLPSAPRRQRADLLFSKMANCEVLWPSPPGRQFI